MNSPADHFVSCLHYFDKANNANCGLVYLASLAIQIAHCRAKTQHRRPAASPCRTRSSALPCWQVTSEEVPDRGGFEYAIPTMLQAEDKLLAPCFAEAERVTGSDLLDLHTVPSGGALLRGTLAASDTERSQPVSLAGTIWWVHTLLFSPKWLPVSSAMTA